jgi:hypothetical protein
MKTGLKLKIEIWVVNRHGWLADYKPATLWIRWNNRIIGINKNGIQR